MKSALIISNYDPDADDVIFSNDSATWNISRALRDCEAGKHKGYTLDVAEAYRRNKNVEVDNGKVKRYMRQPAILQSPLLIIMEGGMAWLVDGHHRLRAMKRLGIRDFRAYVIEEADAKPYQVWFNGKRKAPFDLY